MNILILSSESIISQAKCVYNEESLGFFLVSFIFKSYLIFLDKGFSGCKQLSNLTSQKAPILKAQKVSFWIVMDILFFTHSVSLSSTINSTHRIPFQFKNWCTAYNLLCYTFPHNPKRKGFPNYKDSWIQPDNSYMHLSMQRPYREHSWSSFPLLLQCLWLISSANIKSTIISASHQLHPDLTLCQGHVLTFQYLISNLCLNCFKYFFQYF